MVQSSGEAATVRVRGQPFGALADHFGGRRLDCSSEEKDATPVTWICFSRNEWDVTHPAPSTLTLVDPTTDPFCSFFQDGAFLQPSGGHASGLQQ